MARKPNTKVYIHEFIDIIGHNRAKYMHHMTANWVPVAMEERNQKCFGVWATLGSTGRWPETVNMWELDGWSGLAANFAHEVQGLGAQDPELAKWWAQASQFRRGGVDRILVPEPWSLTIDELIDDGVGGEVYAHELVTTAPGAATRYLEALAEVGCETMAAFEGSSVGAFRVAMRNDTEAIALWAFPSFDAWASFEEAWEGDSMSAWRARLVAMGVDVQRTLLVDAPLAPLRIRRQPGVEDRRPLDEIT